MAPQVGARRGPRSLSLTVRARIPRLPPLHSTLIKRSPALPNSHHSHNDTGPRVEEGLRPHQDADCGPDPVSAPERRNLHPFHCHIPRPYAVHRRLHNAPSLTPRLPPPSTASPHLNSTAAPSHSASLPKLACPKVLRQDRQGGAARRGLRRVAAVPPHVPGHPRRLRAPPPIPGPDARRLGPGRPRRGHHGLPVAAAARRPDAAVAARRGGRRDPRHRPGLVSERRPPCLVLVLVLVVRLFVVHLLLVVLVLVLLHLLLVAILEQCVGRAERPQRPQRPQRVGCAERERVLPHGREPPGPPRSPAACGQGGPLRRRGRGAAPYPGRPRAGGEAPLPPPTTNGRADAGVRSGRCRSGGRIGRIARPSGASRASGASGASGVGVASEVDEASEFGGGGNERRGVSVLSRVVPEERRRLARGPRKGRARRARR